MEALVAFLPFVAIIGVMYFLMVRPQQKKQKEQKDMLDQLKKGDSIVTIGGLHGIIDEIDAEANTVVIDCEGIYLTFERRAVSRVVTKTPAASTTTEELGSNQPEEHQDV